ncbi:hypothetical protein [Pseudidiomarina sp.]|uniref:hypothetical protein n=1 Tax=Pseudidiomarina sp. TaxID=2081707 RepID=UPI00299F39DD|nr:hypothetical protein [Pseudidiomarina sp.]MDX1706203.1 hypothetical protein [Pseudidiomarina sp.]
MKLTTVVVSAGLLMWSSVAAANAEVCELKADTPGKYFVLDSDGDEVGYIELRSDDSWKAWVYERGAAIETFWAPEDAMGHVCRNRVIE